MRRTLVFVALSLGAAAAQAQSRCTMAPAVDSVAGSLYASAWTAEGKRPLRDDEARGLIDGIGRGLRMPVGVPLVALDGARPRSAAVLNAVVMLRLANGHLASALVTTSSGSDAVDSALVGAVERAESGGGFARFRTGEPKTEVIVAFTTLDGAGERGRSAPQSVARLTLPRWALDSGAALGVWNPPIHYPPMSKWSTDAGVLTEPTWPKDTVDIEYLVDETGAIVLPTVRIRLARYGATLDSVQSALPDLHYTPAVAGGCRTPQLVRQRFAFVGHDTTNIDRPAPALFAALARGDTVRAAPTVVVEKNRCVLVPGRDIEPIQRAWGVNYDPDAFTFFSAAVQAVRFAGSNAKPGDAVAVCTPRLKENERLPEDSPYNRGPGFVPVQRSARVITDLQIDTTGRVVKSSMHLIGASDPSAGRGVMRWLESARFDPATINGRPVSSWVRQPIETAFAPSSWYN